MYKILNLKSYRPRFTLKHIKKYVEIIIDCKTKHGILQDVILSVNFCDVKSK
jgi:hypothetical protein